MVEQKIWSSTFEKFLENPSPQTTVRIVTTNSPGLIVDAVIYSKIFPKSVIFVTDAHNKNTNTHQLFDVNLFIQNVNLKFVLPAKNNWLMVNIDMTTTEDLKNNNIDLFLCKTKHTVNILQQHGIKNVLYTKHSSPDIYKNINHPSINYDKYWNLCVHFAGKSWLKNTNAIIQAWITHKIPLKLIVTCKDECYTTLKTRSNKFLKKYNVTIKREISQTDKDHLLKLAGLVLCPSKCEGYGHYINEARSAGAFVLTTDHVSVSELFTGLTVRCIPSTKKSKFTGNLLTEECDIDSQNFFTVIKIYMEMSIAQKKDICIRARKKYENDTLFLINSLRNYKL